MQKVEKAEKTPTQSKPEKVYSSYFFRRFNYDFIGKRKISFVISIITIVLGIGSFLIKGGFDLGIDFKGGTLLELRFEKPVEVDQIRETLKTIELGDSSIQHFGTDKEVLIRVEKGASDEDVSQKVTGALRDKLQDNPFEIRRVESVGPQVGNELTRQAQLALLFAIAGMVLYLGWRFDSESALSVVIITGIAILTIGLSSLEWMYIPLLTSVALIAVLVACIFLDLRFAFAAIIALIHDVMITVGLYSITNREITLPVVASILTLIGYSVNDTIVVFDRIRENLRLSYKTKSFEDIVNGSINQTLSRTILTSVTVFIVTLILYLRGGEVINGFAFGMLVGVITGTYSSIFVASPILVIWQNIVKKKSYYSKR
jgi:preprotein translocase subunit SecF